MGDKMRPKALLLAASFWLVFSSSYAQDWGKINRKLETVSLIQLIVTPDKFHEMQVRVEGVIRIQLEGNGLYLSKEHYVNRVHKNALWLETDESLLATASDELLKLNRSYVLVEGKFNKNKKGHLGMDSGTLEHVNRIMLTED